MSYKDSVRKFLIDGHFFETRYIIDSTALMSCKMDERLLEVHQKRQFYLYDGKYYSPNGKYKTDSVLLKKRDILEAINKMRKPAIPVWDSTYFDRKQFINYNVADSFFQSYHSLLTLWNAIRYRYNWKDSLVREDAKYKRLETEIKEMEEQSLWNPGYSKYSNPIFFKGGRYVVFYCWKFWGRTYITYSISLYKYNKGNWIFFCDLLGGEVN